MQHRPGRPTEPLGGGAAETSKCASLFHFNNGSPVTADPDSPQPDSYTGPHCHHIHNSLPVILKLSLLLCCSTVRVCLIHYLRVRLPSSLFPQIPYHIKASVSISLPFISLLLSLPVVKAHRLSLEKKFLSLKRPSFSAYK